MPRPKKGETAPGVLERSRRCQKTAKNIIAAIGAAVEDPSKITPDMVEACQNVNNLAAWKNSALDIVPISLGSLRTWVDRLYAGKWRGLLLNCNKIIEVAGKVTVSTGTKTHLAIKKEELEQQVSSLRRDQLEDSARYADLLLAFNEFAKSNPKMYGRLNQHLEKFPLKRHHWQVIRGGKDGDEDENPSPFS